MNLSDDSYRLKSREMAEALALIGLVSNIFGFIEFGIAFVSATQYLNDARKIPDIGELDTILARHKYFSKQMESSGVKLLDDESKILDMVTECDEVAVKLRQLTKPLSTRPEARSRAADNFRIVLKFMFNKKEIQELRDRLLRMDNEIRGYIQSAMQR